MRMLRNADDVNDVVQETLVKAFRAIKDFDPARPMRPWLCRICTNCCVDAVRDRRRDGDSLDAHEYALTTGEAIDEQAENCIEQDQVMEAVETGDSTRVLEIVAELERSGANLQHFCRELSRHIRNLLVARITGAGTRLIAASPGFGSVEVRRCVETRNRYLLLVTWDKLEDHTEGFRKSGRYQEWRTLLHHFYDPFPVVERYENPISL